MYILCLSEIENVVPGVLENKKKKLKKKPKNFSIGELESVLPVFPTQIVHYWIDQFEVALH